MSSKVIMLRPPSIKDEGNYIEFMPKMIIVKSMEISASASQL